VQVIHDAELPGILVPLEPLPIDRTHTGANRLPVYPDDAASAPANETAPPADATLALPARFATLGCKVNQYETQYVRELLECNGYREAHPGEPAAVAVVNTCTVTAESDRKSRQLIRHLARTNPGVKIVVMGCYAAADPAGVRRLPGVAAVIPDKRDLAGALRPFGVRRTMPTIRKFYGRHRAFVKVQDGCILNCTFCIIPKVRPGLLSRPVDEISAEVRGLVDAGFREIVLTGIHLGHYGLDLSQGQPRRRWQRLPQLLDRLARLPGEFRLRLSSLEATEVSDDLMRTLADYPERICPHLHLSLQSGSDRILALMQRRYRIARFLDRCAALRLRLDEPAFTTDIIVGFPTETDDDFARTVQALEEVGFSKIHIFPFSPRPGTPAATMRPAVPPQLIHERQTALQEIERRLARQYYQKLVGRALQMLVETPDPEIDGMMRGTACRYAPLRLRTILALAGRLVPVRACRVCDRVIEVEPVVAASLLAPGTANGVGR
jgi:threonylcarbamoyladenosine tRNA methylthiotransferase MtaB